jgi:hypothetical protein
MQPHHKDLNIIRTPALIVNDYEADDDDGANG